MATGSIISFPINTIFQFATSANFGITPKLKSSITKQLSGCDLNSPASELAIRKALNNINTKINFKNLNEVDDIYTYSIFSLSSNYIGLFKSIEILPYSSLTGFINNNTLYISGSFDRSNTVLVKTDTVQGGKYQNCNTIHLSSITTDGNTLFYAYGNENTDIAIGKIIINCLSASDNYNTLYSIGFDNDKERYVKKFSPSAIGLIDFQYGNGLSSEVDLLLENKEIKIYRYGNQNNQGLLRINIFYDEVNWRPYLGYFWYGWGLNTGNLEINRFNIDTEKISNRHSSWLTNKFYIWNSISNNDYIYGAGTYISPNYYGGEINRYDTKNDTISPLNRGILSQGRIHAATFKSSTRGYWIGGDRVNVLNHPSNVCDYILFSNDTMNALQNASLNTARGESGCNFTNIYGYIVGGYINNQNIFFNSIERLTFSNDSIFNLISTTLSVASYAVYSFKTNNYILFGSGRSSGLTNHNILDIMDISNETINSLNNYLIINRDWVGRIQNNIFGYILGGQINFAYGVNLIEKINFSTYTNIVIEEQIDTFYPLVIGSASV